MKKILTYLILSLLSLATYSQNWEQVKGVVSNSIMVRNSTFYVDTVNDYLYLGGGFVKDNFNIPQETYSLLRYKNGVEEILDSVIANNAVYAIYPYKGDLYIGGRFQHIGGHSFMDSAGNLITVGGAKARNLTRLHNDTFEVVVLEENKSTAIHSFAEHNGNLIVGGVFNALAGIHSKGVVAYDGKRFLPLGGGVLNNDNIQYVYALHSFNGNLYAGGNFYDDNKLNKPDFTTMDFQTYLNGKWGSADGWAQYSSFAAVTSMAVYKNELYIAGYFQEKEGDLANSIIKYDGTYFYSLGSGSDFQVYNMKVFKDELFVCGLFDEMDNVKANSIAKWNGKSWCSLSNDSFPNTITDLAFYHDTLYITGAFRDISGQKMRIAAKWIGNPNMEDSCAPPAVIKKVNYNLGIEESKLTELKFNIYPNPVHDILVVEKLKNAGEFTYSLLDINGKEVAQGAVIENQTRIDVSAITSGLYFLKMYNEKEQITKKIKIE